MLIFGQLFIILTLCAAFLYAARLSEESRVLLDIFSSVRLLTENAASGLCLLWITAIFIDYTDKKNNS
jgi:hypothetical protein